MYVCKYVFTNVKLILEIITVEDHIIISLNQFDLHQINYILGNICVCHYTSSFVIYYLLLI